VRTLLGLGLGSFGIATRLGFSGEYWLNDWIGLGGHGAFMGQSQIQILGDSSSSAEQTLAILGSVRTAGRGSYLYFNAGGGFARRSITNECQFWSGDCVETTVRYSGYALIASLGLLTHPGDAGFEIGPVLQADVIRDLEGRFEDVSVYTLNLVLGYAHR
jgi:hypothetical protein